MLKYKKVLCIILSFVMLVGCGGGDPAELKKDEIKKIKQKYGEWIDKLNIVDNDRIRWVGFIDNKETDICFETEKSIGITLFDKNKSDLNEIIKETVDKDTQFVEENPNYFEQGQKREIYYYKSNLGLGNAFGYKTDVDTYGKDLDIDIKHDGVMRVCFINSMFRENKQKLFNENIEVLELGILTSYDDKKNETKAFENTKKEILDSFACLKNLKYIIIKKNQEEFKVDSICDEILERYPSIKVYEVVGICF